MANFFGTNLKFLRKRDNLTQDQLAEKLGLNRPVLGSYEEGRAEPKINALLKIAECFAVTVDQLLRTDLSLNQKLGAAGSDIRLLVTQVTPDNNERISLVPAKASAGYANGYADPEYIGTLPHFSLPFSELSKERTYRAFQVKGDSMDPIPTGAYIVAEYVTDWHNIKDGKTYVVVTRDEGVLYKRVFLHPSGELWLKSDNPAYEPYTIHLSRILELWKAVGFISTMLPEPETPTLNKLSMMMLEMKKEIEQLKNK